LTGALLGPGGIIPAGVLDAVEQAGASLVTPIAGAPGTPLTISGAVVDGSKLSSLSVNGKDVLGMLASDGSFSLQVPGTTKVVTLTAIDKNGVSQTTTSGVTQKQLKVTSVSASGARGIRIAKVHYSTKGTRRTHRVRMIVTVRDRRGLLIRGAKISVRAAKAGRLLRKPKTSSSGPKGRATFVLRLRPAAFGKRLVIVGLAKTPHAKATRRTAVLVPRAKALARR
jgi:hypothetical protein